LRPCSSGRVSKSLGAKVGFLPLGQVWSIGNNEPFVSVHSFVSNIEKLLENEPQETKFDSRVINASFLQQKVFFFLPSFFSSQASLESNTISSPFSL
jgi:hypothetical protein